MTVVKNGSADAYVSNPRRELRFYLLHGTDQGLIHERATTLVRLLLGDQDDPLSLTRIDGETVLREPGRLFDEAYAAPMLGDHRVLWVEAKSRDLARVIDSLIADPPKNCWLVVEASNLKKGSRLRVAFEKADNAVCIECYPDERHALISLIDVEARVAGLEISGDAQDYLLTLLGADRQTTRGELAKLMLYAKGSRRIELEDVEAIVSDGVPSGLTEVINLSLLGELDEVERSAVRFFYDGGDPELLIVQLASQLTLLHNIELEVDKGTSLEIALQKQFARLALTRRTTLTRQAERLTLAALKKRLPTVQKASARVRGDAKLGNLLALRALWGLALLSRTNHER